MLALFLIVAFSVTGAWGVARVWKEPAARLTTLGIVSFAIVVLAAQLVGVLAAATGRPLLTPWALALAPLSTDWPANWVRGHAPLFWSRWHSF